MPPGAVSGAISTNSHQVGRPYGLSEHHQSVSLQPQVPLSNLNMKNTGSNLAGPPVGALSQANHVALNGIGAISMADSFKNNADKTSQSAVLN